jgi:hypothetical protein
VVVIRRFVAVDEEGLARKLAVILPLLNARERRVVLGAEARALGRGGIAAVARAAGVSAHALIELATGDPRPQLRKVYVEPEFAERAAVKVVLATRARCALANYPVRHYRTLRVDTGIAAQNPTWSP